LGSGSDSHENRLIFPGKPLPKSWTYPLFFLGILNAVKKGCLYPHSRNSAKFWECLPILFLWVLMMILSIKIILCCLWILSIPSIIHCLNLICDVRLMQSMKQKKWSDTLNRNSFLLSASFFVSGLFSWISTGFPQNTIVETQIKFQ